MLSQEEISNLFDIFKTGSLDNIELAIQLAKNSNADLYLNQFEELFSFLVQKEIFSKEEIPIQNKVHQILNLKELKLKIIQGDESIIPANLYFLKNLKKLTINSDIVLWVPHTLSYFEYLEELELHLLDQDKIPDVVFELTSLSKLNLSCNLFNEIPRSIWKLRKLKELNLCHCINLEVLPNELFSLPKIERIYLFQTLIDEISPLIAYSNIEVYSIDFDAEIKKLLSDPKVGMTLLKSIDKKNNSRYSKLYAEELKKGTFKRIDIKNIPKNVLNKGIKAIKQYFKENV